MSNIRGDFLDFSPTNFSSAKNKENNNSLPVLSLVQFSRPPFLSFGTVKLGCSKSALLRVENPTEWATEVKVEKIASNKGFSVEQTRFTVQPAGGVTLAINWTPVEEGGVRELVVFTANGIVKHQAVLLGKAEAQKKKKKSLWDSIKKKKANDVLGACKGRGTDSLPKSTINKTFHVSRQIQYTKERVRGPLAHFNNEPLVADRVPVLSASDTSQKNFTSTALKSTHVKLGKALEENVFPFKKDSPIVVLVPAAALIDGTGTDVTKCTTDSECGADEKNVTQMLNGTCPPIKASENYINKPIPCMESFHSPISNASICDTAVNQTFLSGTPVLTVKDALAIIHSDLTQLESASPPNACSSLNLSDSLEPLKGNSDTELLSPTTEITEPIALDDQSFESTSVQPRLTFFVKSKEQDGCQKDENGHVPLISGKIPIASVTVTKSKGNNVQRSSLEACKSNASRRLVLERSLESTQDILVKPNLGKTNNAFILPIIDSAPISKDAYIVNSHVSGKPLDFSPIKNAGPCAFSNSSVGTATVVTADQSPEPQSLVLNRKVMRRSAARSSEDWPEGSTAGNVLAKPTSPSESGCKKRKSDEFLKENFDENIEVFQVKRIRAFPENKQSKAVRERCFSSRSVSERLQKKTAASQSSHSSTSSKSSVGHSKMTVSRPAKQRSQSVKSCAVSSVKTAKVAAVAQSHLTFIKPAQTVIPRHPLPFAAKNMFYDERWIEKQERGFTLWINYILTPDEFRVDTEVTRVNAMSLVVQSDKTFSVSRAPTKEELSFRAYTARRRLNRLRRAACQLFTSEPVVKAIQRLELEVESKRLLMRKDRHICKDIGQRQKVLNWLLSYNPLWLRIGLETIYGELISLESNNDVTGLAMFILNRLLWNPDLAAQYRHPTVPHLYRNGHDEALSSFTMKKLLLLVCFLDKAKESKLIEHDPCLFYMDAEFKSSKDLLLAFSRDFLSGEGILPRHLGHLGFAVSHSQTPLDEFDFAVKNLAVDLRCGVRLVRIMELLSKNWNLSQKLRMPAISRLQKVHNVEIALQVLRSKGIELKDEHGSTIDSRDIVDGHREKTITLLWRIIFAFQVDILLDEEKLKEEICFLNRMWKTKQQLAAWKNKQNVVVDVRKTKSTFEHNNAKMSLLMDWVNSVCAFYSLKAENFTVSFSDGRILCYLVHHYHPCHLPLEAVSQKTTQTVECAQRGTVGLDCSSSDSDNSLEGPGLQTGTETPVDFKELLENEKINFQLLKSAVSFLGGVPAMIMPDDMSNTIPNEKVVTCYLTFLCARLLDLRTETRAAWIIQGAWKKYRLKMEERIFKEKSAAATIIQGAVKRFLQRRRKERQNLAVVILQSVWRGRTARQKASQMRQERVCIMQTAAATVIQAHWRRYSAMKHFHKMRHHAIVIQSYVRMRMAVVKFKGTHWAVTTIQKRRKAWILGKRERQNYLLLRHAAVTIQRCFRRWKVLSLVKRNNAATVIQSAFRTWRERKAVYQTTAALKIQSWYRMQMCRRQYTYAQKKAVIIQAWYRGFKNRKHYQHLKLQHYSATIIQRSFKTYVLRKRFLEIRQASVVIQNWYRTCKKKEKDRLRYLKIKRAAVALQAAYRGYVVRKGNRIKHEAAVAIQSAFRMFVHRKRLLMMKRAATAMQQRYRAKILGRKLRGDYVALRLSVTKLQAFWRGRAERRRIEQQREAAVLIQSHYRRHTVQANFRLKRRAMVVLQNRLRAYLTGRKVKLQYLEMRKAAVTVQAMFRGLRVRRALRKEQRAAALIQAAFKTFLCKRRFLSLKRAATVVQRRYRARLMGECQRRQYGQLQQAAIKLQAAYRGSKVRRNVRRMHRASTVIQACFRMRKVRISFLAAKCAAIVIQQHYRAYVTGRRQHENYVRIRQSAVILQSAFRGSRARLQVKKMHKAATIIQAHFRKRKQFARFERLRWAASVVQQRFRALQLKNAEVRKYRAIKHAAVCIQSAFRGTRTRKQIREMQNAARTIQRNFIAHRDRKRFLRRKAAAVKIQQWYRAVSAARLQQKCYRSMLAAVIKVQAMYRGVRVRKELWKRYQAATVIQAAFKMYRQRMPFKALKLAATLIQQRYRCHLSAKRGREHFLKMRRSAVVIQAAFRGHQVRRDLDRMRSAALVIQAQFRMQKQLAQYKKMLWAAKVIQNRYRASRERDSVMRQYKTKKDAATVIQSAYRSYKVKQKLKNVHNAATVIQRRFLAFRSRRQFLSLRAATVIIQNRYRAFVAAKDERAAYLMKRKAAITIQASYRGLKARRQLQKERKAAVIIQALIRGHIVRSFCRRLQWAAETVQKHYRANNLMKAAMQELKQKKSAIILIQASFRAMKVRQQVRKMHKAACDIQRAFRAYSTRKKYLCLKSAVVAMQLRYRAAAACRRQRQRYHEMRSAAVSLQAACRGWKSRKILHQQHQAATLLQTTFRRHREMVKYQAMRLSAVVVQRYYRSYVQSKQERDRFCRLRNATVVIQAAFRRWKSQKELAKLHKAAILIQAKFKMHRQRVAFRRLCWAASVLQQRFQAQRLRNAHVEQYQMIRNAAICLQSSFRAKKVRQLLKQKRAVQKIQSFLRMSIDRRRFLRKKAASVIIQSAFRCLSAQIQYRKMQISCVLIQRWYRACKMAHKQRTEYLTVREATVTLQCAFRGMLARGAVKRMRSALKIQSVLHMFMYRKRFLHLQSSTVKIQAYYRMFRVRREFVKHKKAALTFQKHYRAQQAKRVQKSLYLKTLKSIQTIQAWLRGHIARKMFCEVRHSTITIQAFYRGTMQRRRFQQQRSSVKIIQAYYRAYVLGRKERTKYMEMRKSAILIQAAFRGQQGRLRMKEWKAATRIQAWFKGNVTRREFIVKQNAAVVIQSAYRAYVQSLTFRQQRTAAVVLQKRFRALRRGRRDREAFKNTKAAAVTLQAFCRGWLVRTLVKKEAQARRVQRFSAAVYHHLCAIKIQRALRAHWTLESAKKQLSSVVYIQACVRARVQRKRYLNDRAKLIKLQRKVRQWVSRRKKAATVIQCAIRKFLDTTRKQRALHGITKLQALWRGHRSRRLNDSKKLIVLRHRLRRVNLEVKEEDRLCNKTTVAIDFLLRYKHFSDILAALKHLETATRLSPECCEHLVKSGATTVIFTLIRSCNRSIPCMEVISYAVQVLLNLSKYDKTTVAVYEVEDSVETLLDLMQIYKEKAGDKVADKGSSIFTKTCLLLVILLHDHQRALEIRALPKAVDRVGSIYRLTLHKHKKDAERTVIRQKMNASLNGSFLAQTASHKMKRNPRFAPDWVLGRKNKEVVDPLCAVQMVARAFGIIP